MPPTSASTKRVGIAWLDGSAATSTPDVAACETTSGPPPSSTAAAIASSDDERDLRRARPDRRDQQVADGDPERDADHHLQRAAAAQAGREAEHDRAPRSARRTGADGRARSCAIAHAIPAAAAACRIGTPAARSSCTRRRSTSRALALQPAVDGGTRRSL